MNYGHYHYITEGNNAEGYIAWSVIMDLLSDNENRIYISGNWLNDEVLIDAFTAKIPESLKGLGYSATHWPTGHLLNFMAERVNEIAHRCNYLDYFGPLPHNDNDDLYLEFTYPQMDTTTIGDFTFFDSPNGLTSIPVPSNAKRYYGKLHNVHMRLTKMKNSFKFEYAIGGDK